jgi:hypothetical protein
MMGIRLVLSIGVDIDHNPKHKRGNSQSFCSLLALRVVISRNPNQGNFQLAARASTTS